MKYAVVDLFGTPFPENLHVVERSRLIDFEEVRKIWRATQTRIGFRQGPARSTGKHLQVRFTVGDEGVFTMRWIGTSPMGGGSNDWPEIACAETSRHFTSPTPTLR